MDGLVTAYLEAGQGDPVVLLHGGEFGVSAELGWEHTIAALASQPPRARPGHAGLRRVQRRSSTSMTAAVCGSATLRGSARPSVSSRRISSATRWARSICSSTPPRMHLCCRCAAWWRSAVAARSNGTNIRPRSTTTTPRSTECDGSSRPCFTTRHIPPTRRMCSGDTSRASRRAHGKHWRQQGFADPGLEPPALPSSARAYDRIAVPTLVVEGGGDKLLPRGWAAEIAGQIASARSAVIPDAGHCPQIEQPAAVNDLLLAFLAEHQVAST